MPGVSRTQRAEAKYNVTLEFPHLGLHSAAASGNLGLVKYALDHGQPINSVIDGVLPLHAACSGGNDLVVRLLIEKGADVNAPRLPRRYSSDRNRDNSAPIVGTSGSTPLHFACANGHTNVVLTLLLHGAHPGRPDKHGITPEVIARQNGWIACADVVRQWSHNKDKDLREREARSGVHTPAGEPLSSKDDPHAYCGASGCKECSTWKRLRGKRSIDNMLNALRPSISQTPSSSSTIPSATADSPDPSMKPLGQYTFYDTADSGTADELPPRRPSLPHAIATPESTPSRKSHHHTGSSSRRPRSAGTDTDASSIHHKVKGKISLLSIFKKNMNDSSGTPETHSGSSSALTSTSASPAASGLGVSPSLAPSSDILPGAISDMSSISSYSASKGISSMYSDSDSSSIYPPLAVDLHHKLSTERLRTRSTSNSSAGTEAVSSSVSCTGPLQQTRRPPVRPSILRPHGRSSSSSSSGQMESRRRGSAGQSSLRALRFDSSSTGGSSQMVVVDRSPSRSMSGNLLEDSPEGQTRSPRSRSHVRAESAIDEEAVQVSAETEDVFAGDEEEEEYGEPVAPQVGVPRVRSRLTSLKIENSPRRLSMVSSRSSSSALPSPSSPVSPDAVIPTVAFDCPFSINRPPTVDPESEPAPSNLLGIHGVERPRGDSVSSISTTASANPASSSGASGYITTPALTHSYLPPALISSPESHLPELSFPDSLEVDPVPQKAPILEIGAFPAHRVHRVPLDIDIHSISSHAQAEALVQRAQRSILEMHDEENQTVDVECRSGLGAGRTPLSAKLAAYGETLEIERKFKEEERRMRSLDLDERVHAAERLIATSAETALAISAKGLERKFSLEERPRRVHGPRQARPRRPHTAGGTPSSDTLGTSSSDGAVLSSRGASASQSKSRLPPDSAPAMTDHFRSASATLLPPSSSYLQPDVHPSPRRIRSRTPDPTRTDVPSLDRPALGVPLSRIATAPPEDTFQDLIPNRAMTEHERQVARANKLTKMGFQSSETWQHSASHPRGQGSSKSRFGIKTFVQSLKGKP
ncbi:hypothetical protein OBBRIDRAFT_761438 [Obba rivulosa]|uniref:Ankyrin n=1 Tax=Obba rivulosa TaxID=1052685 RepID=A0A8E2AN76_9APHY|nr:hypothetical protein OBBRIDRAFT_761438 [Obba rivulosa]